MIVMKFGGSSVATRAEMERVAAIVAAHPGPVVLVLSAMGKTTDQLLQLAGLAEQGDAPALEAGLDRLQQAHLAAVDGAEIQEQITSLCGELRRVLEGVRLLREQTPRSRALICSFGERLSTPILAAHLDAVGRAARAMDAREFVVTDDDHEAARVDLDLTRTAARAALEPLLAQQITPVVTGFLGATPGGITTVLGRGGSDYSAALLGSLLGAVQIWIWTDVDGILTADPSLVREARTLEQVSYREAAEMSYFGAKVLHPKTIGPAVADGIPIHIKNTFRPRAPGTVIARTSPALPRGVKTVSSIHELALVTIEGRGMSGVPGVARRVFEATERARVNVLMISQASSEQTITFVVPEADAARLTRALEQTFALELRAGAVDRVVTQPRVAVVSIVGQGMAGAPGISGRLFGALGRVQVNVLAIAQGSSELSISVALHEADARRAVRAIHSTFGLTRVVNLVLLGDGRVSRAFQRQLAGTRQAMQRELGLELRLVGLCTSRRLLLDDGGIDPEQAHHRLQGADPRPDDAALLRRLLETRCTDLVLVDLTAADTGPLLLQALRSQVHVVTANKRPLSGTQALYHDLTRASRETGARLAYETTFGAGLPVLHTLQELRDTGDAFRHVSGCFSGTLGFICSQLEQGEGLEQAVARAAELGLTEPDPREDLSGRDVARKALIIARSVGLTLEPDAVELQPMVDDLDQGLEQALARHGADIARRVSDEKSHGRVLRYVASIDASSPVRVGLQAVAATDPIGALQGQDNMLVYRTQRYDQFPLVIRGPGAGAEVTAAGVLGDVLKVARGAGLPPGASGG